MLVPKNATDLANLTVKRNERQEDTLLLVLHSFRILSAG